MSENTHENESIQPKFFIESLPPELAVAFVSGKLNEIEGAHIVYSNEACTVWRCYEKNIHLSNIGDVRLYMDYKKFNEKHDPPGGLVIEFKYVTNGTSQSDQGEPIADMSWYKPEHPEINHPYDFNLLHRLVHPDFSKRTGIGTQLYLQAESFMLDIANQKKEKIELAVAVSQFDVIAWVQKPNMGYSAYNEEDAKTLVELAEHRERFDTEPTDKESDPGMPLNIIYRKDTSPRQYVRVWFKKTIHPDTQK